MKLLESEHDASDNEFYLLLAEELTVLLEILIAGE